MGLKQNYWYIFPALFILVFVFGCDVGRQLPICTDTDGGQVFDTLGYVNFNASGRVTSFRDECLSGTTVVEYFCLEGHFPFLNASACPASQSCVNGECKQVNVVTCIDSDSGLTYSTSGQVTVTLSAGPPKIFTDDCLNNLVLKEYYCSSLNSYALEKVSCPGGCSAGACQGSNVSCTNAVKDGSETGVDCGGSCPGKCGLGIGCFVPSDCSSNTCSGGGCVAAAVDSCVDTDGSNALTFGTVTYFNSSSGLNSSFTDSCLNNVTVNEQICSGTLRSISLLNCSGGQSCSGGICVAVIVDSCSDSDGANLFFQGTVSGNKTGVPYSYSDSCASSKNVSERTCSGVNAINSTSPCGVDGLSGSNFCQTGNVYRNFTNYSCAVGACSAVNTPQLISTCTSGCTSGVCNSANISCTDSDGGLTYATFGFINFTNSSGTYIQNDACVTPNVLGEYFCTGSASNGSLYSCPAGQSCLSGRCISNTCVDTDFFNNYITNTLNYTNSSGSFLFTDSCTGNTLTEQYCIGVNRFTTTFSCQNGCFNNSCLYVYGTSCSNPDGTNFSIVGNASLSLSNTSIFIYNDVCFNLTSVNEAICLSAIVNTSGNSRLEWNATLNRTACPFGRNCSLGRCN